MARKNNPAQTIEKIVSVSTKLFVEKGYEKTSMQDIVDALGMSKGAIFHHFKSKEEILHTVLKRQCDGTKQIFHQWIEEMQGLSAKEILVGLLEKNLKSQKIQALNTLSLSLFQNPHFIVANMRDGVNNNAPIFAKIFRDGIKDGSITTEFPDELAEIFFLLLNIWCNPVVFECDPERFARRFTLFQQTMKRMGVDVLSDELLEGYVRYIKELFGSA